MPSKVPLTHVYNYFQLFAYCCVLPGGFFHVIYAFTWNNPPGWVYAYLQTMGRNVVGHISRVGVNTIIHALHLTAMVILITNTAMQWWKLNNHENEQYWFIQMYKIQKYVILNAWNDIVHDTFPSDSFYPNVYVYTSFTGYMVFLYCILLLPSCNKSIYWLSLQYFKYIENRRDMKCFVMISQRRYPF